MRRAAPPSLVRPAVVLVAVALVLAVLPGLADPASSRDVAEKRRAGSITLTPRQYIAGETLTITGSIGASGRRAIVLQRYMRDHYIDTAKGRTDARGRFRFTVPGPGMATPYSVFVPSLGRRTANAPVEPIEQGFGFAFSPSRPVAGEPLTVRVGVTPVRAGRPVTLLRRTSPSSWATAGRGTTDARGIATIATTAPAAGEVVYRALAGAMRGTGINEFPSFPTYLQVEDALQGARSGAPASRTAATTTDLPDLAARAKAPYRQPGPVHAGNTFGWWPTAAAWDWEWGEALSPWTEYGTGTGRAAVGWAMLTVDSGPTGRGWDNRGTTRVTLGGKGRKYGRWEIRMRVPHWDNGGPDHRVKAELVPTSTAPGACSDRTITFADFTGYESTVDLGVTNGRKSWAHTVGGVRKNRDDWHTYAVEVTKKRIAFFVDATPVSTLKGKAGPSGKPLTVRLSLIAPDETTEMAHTRIGVDWVRYWSMAKKGTGQAKINKAPAPRAGRDISC